MDHSLPLSPAMSKGEALPLGFSELLQHNQSISSAPREAATSDLIRVQSQSPSRYGTPLPQSHHLQSFDPYQQQLGGSQLAGYQQTMYQHDSSPYGPLPEANLPYSTPATSPPTPSRASDMMSIRSGVIGKALAPKSTRIEKAAAKKKKKERAKPAKNVPAIDRPMSELTKDSTIEIADIESYVHRSAQVRQDEVKDCKKNPGKIKRPMNAFMLYRKAYQQRAKEWASQHNHQVVSRVCGSSWPLEPEHIRAQFKTWADIERDNHQKAHPNYKFTPSKPQKPVKYDDNFDHSEASDLDEFGEWHSGPGMRSSTNTPNDDREYIPSRSVYAATHHHLMMPGMGGPHQTRSAFDFGGSPARGIGSGYDERDLANHYYQQQRHFHLGGIEDVLRRQTPSPSIAFQSTHGMHPNYDLSHYHHAATHQQPLDHATHPSSQPHSQSHPQPQRFEQRIDPSLMTQEDVLFDSAGNLNSMSALYENGVGSSQQSWQTTQLTVNHEPESQFQTFAGLDETLSVEPHAQYLRDADGWQVEHLPDTGHFDSSWAETKAET
ncbi:hypothetical protein QBC43DRAFT_207910 [Cladorrhinum sp. PSN259]|nr:hypothetical protein QBC43DRAFT_207910 [Cladorrhinum sp. PSN259]